MSDPNVSSGKLEEKVKAANDANKRMKLMIDQSKIWGFEFSDILLTYNENYAKFEKRNDFYQLKYRALLRTLKMYERRWMKK